MRSRGIIFQAKSIRGILAGTKTQTRRVLKLRDRESVDGISGTPNPPLRAFVSTDTQPTAFRQIACPYGATGDLLWCKETWGVLYPQYIADLEHEPTFYKSDWTDHDLATQVMPCWRSPLFMPRNRSRLTLEIVDVRIQRLQAITEEDARAEGIIEFNLGKYGSVFGVQGVKGSDVEGTSVEAYATLWDQINGSKYPWTTSPWVWALTFKIVTP